MISTNTFLHRRITTKEVVQAGMFAALMATISQISIPMPSGIPLTIQVFGVILTGVVLGWRIGLLATLVYILLGSVGLPIFSNFRGGLDMLVGMTGGYILGWPLMVVLAGIKPKTSHHGLNMGLILLLSIIGLLVDELMGGLQWAALAGNMSLWAIFTYSMAAFVPKDICLTIAAVILGLKIRNILSKSGMLQDS